ncbi:hypothetical protein BDV36DRAFT_252767 [Aspergillus pseudocaelatus]|uniref:Fungal N-terminal domain-containing protein n=1 Tax=Aspergillus pseudocaelatus TaxID=1825620 RepID=A0ABQ6WPI0_9EURO|nr:hypothetical protein BDV36DRAFT_252767 [Aspergillus pseudocaelatus]
MSGLEVVGVAASLLQLADLGAKISVKLFGFCRHAKNINQSMQSLSSEVALTCAILRELGEVLSQDGPSKLCSKEAFRTAQQVLNECQKVLLQLRKMTENANEPTTSRMRRATGTIKNVFLEPNVDPLKENLERLKSTMLLLLNVIMYAAEVRQHTFPTKLQDQRTVIEGLLEERVNHDQEANHTRRIDKAEAKNDDDGHFSATVSQGVSSQKVRGKVNRDGQDELQVYDQLIRQMLFEVDICKEELERDRGLRIRDGVLSIHASEVVRYQLTHGPSVIQRLDVSGFQNQTKDKHAFPNAEAQTSEMRRKSESLQYSHSTTSAGTGSTARPSMSKPVSNSMRFQFDDMDTDEANETGSTDSEDTNKVAEIRSPASDDSLMSNDTGQTKYPDRLADEIFRKCAEDDAKRASQRPQTKGWRTWGFFSSGHKDTKNKPVRAALGEENSFFYDTKLKRWVKRNSQHSSTVKYTDLPVHEDLISDLIGPNPSRKERGQKSVRRNNKSRYVDYLSDIQTSDIHSTSITAPSVPSTSYDSVHSGPSSVPVMDSFGITGQHVAEGTTLQDPPPTRGSYPSNTDIPVGITTPTILSDGKVNELDAWSDNEFDKTPPPSDLDDWPFEDFSALDSGMALPTKFATLVSHWTTLRTDEIR